MSQFVHLHVHTQYSILDGLSDIPKLIAKAKDGTPAIWGDENEPRRGDRIFCRPFRACITATFMQGFHPCLYS